MRIIFQLLLVLSLAACSKPEQKTNQNPDLSFKLNELEQLKAELNQLNDKIAKKEAEIVELDPSRAQAPKLVTTVEIAPEGFQHFIDLQGQVSSTNVSYVAPRNGAGGYVKQLYIKAGDQVKKGQLLMKLDDQVLRQSIETLKTQLSLAKNVYERTQKLWDQGIGSELQFMNAKTNVETLESQIKTQEEQLKTFIVYADQSGIADIVNIKVGELFTGVTAQGPQIQIVNNTDMSIMVDVPENYTNDIKKGAEVVVEIPALNKNFKSTIFRLSNSINTTTRGYTAEIKIPATANAKPNMAATVKILNHTNSKAIVIPINIVQSDDKGKFVIVMKKDGERYIASRKQIKLGNLYNDNIEVLSGLEPGDEIITVGFQGLYEGQRIASIKSNGSQTSSNK